MTDFPIISATVWLPILGGIAVLLAGDGKARQLSLVVSVLTFGGAAQRLRARP